MALPGGAERQLDYASVQQLTLANLTIEGRPRKVLITASLGISAPANGTLAVPISDSAIIMLLFFISPMVGVWGGRRPLQTSPIEQLFTRHLVAGSAIGMYSSRLPNVSTLPRRCTW